MGVTLTPVVALGMQVIPTPAAVPATWAILILVVALETLAMATPAVMRAEKMYRLRRPLPLPRLLSPSARLSSHRATASSCAPVTGFATVCQSLILAQATRTGSTFMTQFPSTPPSPGRAVGWSLQVASRLRAEETAKE